MQPKSDIADKMSHELLQPKPCSTKSFKLRYSDSFTQSLTTSFKFLHPNSVKIHLLHSNSFKLVALRLVHPNSYRSNSNYVKFKLLHTFSTGCIQTHSSKLKLLHLSSFKILHPNSFKLKLLHSNSFQTGCIQTGCTRTLSAGLQGADPHLLLVVCFGAALANMIIAGLRAAIEDKCMNNHGIGVINIHMNSIFFCAKTSMRYGIHDMHVQSV